MEWKILIFQMLSVKGEGEEAEEEKKDNKEKEEEKRGGERGGGDDVLVLDSFGLLAAILKMVRDQRSHNKVAQETQQDNAPLMFLFGGGKTFCAASDMK